MEPRQESVTPAKQHQKPRPAVRSAFKSPFADDRQKDGRRDVSDANREQIERQIHQLKETENSLSNQIQSLKEQGYCEQELQTHITKLHQYNELKDIGQMLIGAIAVKSGVTTKQIYEKFGLEFED